MVQMGPGMGPESEGRRLGGGAIASLVGVGLLVVFMLQNTESVRPRLPLLALHLAAVAPHVGRRALGALVWFDSA